MIRTLTASALKHRVAAVVLAAALAAAGVWAFLALKIEAYPDISDTQVVVVTQFPGHAAEEMEQQITIPIERALNSLPSVAARRSRTIFGLSVVEITFTYGTDDYFARQVVLERLRDASLPDGVEPEIAPLTTPAGELYRFVIEGGGKNEMELRELQDWVVVPRLLQEDGVADVAVFGGLVKQFQIEIDPLSLEKYDLTIAQVARAVGANNRNAGGALLDNRQQSMVVRGVGLLRSAEDIGNVVLNAPRGVPVFVRDVGRVSIGPAPQTGIFGLDSKSGGIEGLVLMRRGENPSVVLRGVKEAIEEINATRLPPGVHIRPIYDRSELVANTLHTVSHTLAEGLLIVGLVLFLFLGSVRAALLTAVVIPLSLLFAFLCMQLYGIPASLLSLGALDFGIIVDGTLVMVEFMVRELADEKDTGTPAAAVVERAALKVQRPVFLTLLILISAYLPLFTLQSVERRLFMPMAFTICAALVGSMLLTLTVVPALATWMFGRGFAGWKNPALAWVSGRYRRDLRLALARPRAVVAGGAAAVALALVAAAHLGTEFLPQLDEGVIWIRANLAPGTSLTKSAEIASDIRSLIRQSPEVKLVASQSGRVDSGTDPFGPNRNELLVTLNPYDTWPHGKTKRDLVEELSRRLHEQIPGADFNFTQPIIDMVTEAVTGSSADLAVILTGPDLLTLRSLAERCLDIVRTIPGAADTAIEQEADQPQVRIDLDRNALARYALNVEDVQDLIEMAIGGKNVGSVIEGERRFDITVRYVPGARADNIALGNILVRTPEGGRVPLSQLAAIHIANGASIIARRENQRQVTVRTNVRGRDQGSFVAEAQKLFARNVRLPDGYRVVWGGQFENLSRAQKRLSLILPVTVAIIFGLLYWTFGSARLALIVLMTVPFSLVGGVFALYLRGINLSVSAAVGFVSLFGVAVMAGVIYVGEMRQRTSEPGAPLKQAVLEAACTELRPLLMLITVAMLGMMPAALATGIGSDIQRPLATVVVGGLVSTLLLTTMVLPSLYAVMARGENR
jgi:cobalt-zinc-cadmium resistance protein CzcA